MDTMAHEVNIHLQCSLFPGLRGKIDLVFILNNQSRNVLKKFKKDTIQMEDNDWEKGWQGHRNLIL